MSGGGGGEPRGQRVALIVAALLVVVIVFLASGGDPERSSAVRPSTLLLGEGGAQALFDVAQLLELRPQRSMKPLTALRDAEPRGVLILLEPEEALAADEVDGLLRFVDGGGSVVYAPPATDFVRVLKGKRGPDRLLAALDLADGDGNALLDPLAAPADFAPPDDVSPFGRELLAEVESPVRGFGRAFVLPAEGADERASGGTLEPLLVAPTGKPDRSVAVGAALVTRPGAADGRSGRILLIADAAELTNGELRKSGLAPLVVRALAAMRGDGPLLFDEFHHGFDESGGLLTATWRWLTTSPIGHALIAVAIAGLLALVGAGLRFGAAIPRPLPERRSALEHVEALARAWQRNGALRRPRELLVEGLRLRLGGAAELAPLGELAELAARGRDPIALARRIDQVLAELRPQTTPTPSKERPGGRIP